MAETEGIGETGVDCGAAVRDGLGSWRDAWPVGGHEVVVVVVACAVIFLCETQWRIDESEDGDGDESGAEAHERECVVHPPFRFVGSRGNCEKEEEARLNLEKAESPASLSITPQPRLTTLAAEYDAAIASFSCVGQVK